MIEELSLLVNDGLGDAQDGVEALLDVLDQPACLLQLTAQAAALCAVLLQQAEDIPTGPNMTIHLR